VDLAADRATGGVGRDRYDGSENEPESWDEGGHERPARSRHVLVLLT
jgi:hypothetical protein